MRSLAERPEPAPRDRARRWRPWGGALAAAVLVGLLALVLARAAGPSGSSSAATAAGSVPAAPGVPGTPGSLPPTTGPAGTQPASPGSTPTTATTTPEASGPASTRSPAVPAVPAVAPGPGHWAPLGSLVAGVPAMYVTQVPAGSGVATVVWIDPHLARFALHPGGAEPGGTWSTPSSVAPTEMPDLLAAFNSGFKMKDSHGGFYLDGAGASTLQDGAATFAVSSSGALDVGQWGRDMTLADTVVAARQNLTLLVDHGAAAPTVDAQPRDRWGATMHAAVDVWRSGVGVTADGAVLYAAGPALNAKTLAAAFVEAGAQRAMELDINRTWVTFNTYDAEGVRPPTGAKLLADMSQPANRYLAPDSRDFVTVLRRPDPTPPSPPPAVTVPPA